MLIEQHTFPTGESYGTAPEQAHYLCETLGEIETIEFALDSILRYYDRDQESNVVLTLSDSPRPMDKLQSRTLSSTKETTRWQRTKLEMGPSMASLLHTPYRVDEARCIVESLRAIIALDDSSALNTEDSGYVPAVRELSDAMRSLPTLAHSEGTKLVWSLARGDFNEYVKRNKAPEGIILRMAAPDSKTSIVVASSLPKSPSADSLRFASRARATA